MSEPYDYLIDAPDDDDPRYTDEDAAYDRAVEERERRHELGLDGEPEGYGWWPR